MEPRRHTRRRLLAVAGCSLTMLAAVGTASAAGPAPGEARALADALRAGPLTEVTAAPEVRALAAVTGSAQFTDTVGDGDGLAPDLQQMTVGTADDGRFTTVIGLNTNALVDGDLVATDVNTDGNAATGEPTTGGADIVVGILGRTGSDVVGLLRWDGTAWQATASPASFIAFPSGTHDAVWSASAADLGIASGVPVTMVFASLYEGYYDTYYDVAPESGEFTFLTGALAPPPPPPAPVASPPPAAPPMPATSAVTRPAAQPFVVSGFAVTPRAATLRARAGWVGGTGRVTWRITATARLDGRTVSRAVRGAGPAGARGVTRTLALPPAWSGSRVRVVLEVVNGSRVVVRTRSVRLPG